MVESIASQDSEFRESVRNINDYLKKLDAGIMPLSEAIAVDKLMASTSFLYANIRTFVAVIKPKGQTGTDLIFSTPVCSLPNENLLPFYQQLLVWNNLQTDVAHFAVNDAQKLVYLVIRRPVLDLEYSEFRYCADKISSITLNGLFLLKQKFGI